MGYQFQPKDSNTQNQSLVVQDLSIRGNDGMFVFGGGALPAGSPILGAAAGFSVLGGSAITNSASAPSVVTGDMGIAPNGGSSVTGFPPATVTGADHFADGLATQAQVALAAALADLSTRASTPIAADLGGQTLTPGVYSEASLTFNLAASGDQTLIFNGAGLYVIICASTLNIGAGGIPLMLLQGGAQASDIYWVVGSTATINIGVTSAGATFEGNVLAATSITVTQGGSIINGRLLAHTGAVTFSNATDAATGTKIHGVDSSCIILIREPIKQVDEASVKIDSTNLLTLFPLASVTIVDSITFLADATSNKDAIKISGLPSLEANDLVVVKYRVLEQKTVR